MHCQQVRLSLPGLFNFTIYTECSSGWGKTTPSPHYTHDMHLIWLFPTELIPPKCQLWRRERSVTPYCVCNYDNVRTHSVDLYMQLYAVVSISAPKHWFVYECSAPDSARPLSPGDALCVSEQHTSERLLTLNFQDEDMTPSWGHHITREAVLHPLITERLTGNRGNYTSSWFWILYGNYNRISLRSYHVLLLPAYRISFLL